MEINQYNNIKNCYQYGLDNFSTKNHNSIIETHGFYFVAGFFTTLSLGIAIGLHAGVKFNEKIITVLKNPTYTTAAEKAIANIPIVILEKSNKVFRNVRNIAFHASSLGCALCSAPLAVGLLSGCLSENEGQPLSSTYFPFKINQTAQAQTTGTEDPIHVGL